jgi:hypothetical protein
MHISVLRESELNDLGALKGLVVIVRNQRYSDDAVDVFPCGNTFEIVKLSGLCLYNDAFIQIT